MRTVVFLLWGLSAVAQSSTPPPVTNARLQTRAFAGDLQSQFQTAGPAWFGYAIKSKPQNSRNCGSSDGLGDRHFLEGRSATTNRADVNAVVELEAEQSMAVLFRVVDSRVEKVEAYPKTCMLDAGGLPFTWLSNVPASVSLSYLHNLVLRSGQNHLADAGIFAIAQHDMAEADQVLADLSKPAQPEAIREKTAFWLGASRGKPGFLALKRMLADDPSDQVRDKAIFALSVSKESEALDELISHARTDRSPHIRSQSLFWLAQKAGARASSTIVDAITNDPDSDVKKHAVFALSQIPAEEGVPKLIEVARRQRNPQVKKQAFFWLGQSHDPRALAFFEQVLQSR